MNLVFIGPPYAGKGTQTHTLSKELGIPVFSMGALIREAYKAKDPRAVKGFEEYSLKGKHVPIELKFPLLEEKLRKATQGFIIDNFPATQEDLEVFNQYLDEHHIVLDKVFCLIISEEEMKKRMVARGRGDDHPEIVETRRRIQDQDRIPVIRYFKEKGILEEIDGEKDRDMVYKEIREKLHL